MKDYQVAAHQKRMNPEWEPDDRDAIGAEFCKDCFYACMQLLMCHSVLIITLKAIYLNILCKRLMQRLHLNMNRTR